jgi:hypothetical protein
VFWVLAQPLVGLHESVVQGLLSLQVATAPGIHALLPQTSPTVHAFPSVHGAVFGVLRQPLPSAHESVVQGLLSLQDRGAWPTHAPLVQVSPTVQALPSLHAS